MEYLVYFVLLPSAELSVQKNSMHSMKHFVAAVVRKIDVEFATSAHHLTPPLTYNPSPIHTPP